MLRHQAGQAPGQHRQAACPLSLESPRGCTLTRNSETDATPRLTIVSVACDPLRTAVPDLGQAVCLVEERAACSHLTGAVGDGGDVGGSLGGALRSGLPKSCWLSFVSGGVWLLADWMRSHEQAAGEFQRPVGTAAMFAM